MRRMLKSGRSVCPQRSGSFRDFWTPSYIQIGSCGLEYRLVEVPGALRNGGTDPSWTSLTSEFWIRSEGFQIFKFYSKAYSWGDIIFTVVWLAFVLLIAYNLIASCFRRSNGGGRGGSRPRSGGGGGGGWFPGGHRPGDDWSNPPPPYSKDPPNQEGWRPGFWTGAAVGGLANQFWNSRRQAEPRPYWNQWNQVPVAGGSGPMFGGFGARRPARFDDDDRGEGPSNLGSMRRSTGVGGSNVR